MKNKNVIGALWMIASVVLFQAMYTTVKYCGVQLSAIQMTFVRSWFQMLILMPLLFKYGFHIMKTKQYKNYTFRLFFGVSNIVSSFYAFSKIQMATATALSFTSPLFNIIMAYLILREKAGINKTVATCLGFVGTLIVLNPSVGISVPELSALLAAFTLAVTYIYVQKLSHTEHPVAMLMYFGIACFVLTIYPAITHWTPMSAQTYFHVFMIALESTVAQYCVIQAYKIAKTTVVSPLNYLQIPISALIGYFMYQETIDMRFVIGVLIILITSFYVVQKK
ncbi:MAG: DMT family transporter [Alphaproteobacteria bacterium]|nr:DMT family transporter [Alphaproteobacteria bacterium]